MKKYEPIKPGYCGICEKQIWIMGKRRWKPNRDYTEVSLILSDDSVARTSLCKDCAVNFTDKKSKKLFGRIKASWERDMANKASAKQFGKIKKLSVTDKHYNHREAQKISKKIKIKKHNDKLKK